VRSARSPNLRSRTVDFHWCGVILKRIPEWGQGREIASQACPNHNERGLRDRNICVTIWHIYVASSADFETESYGFRTAYSGSSIQTMNYRSPLKSSLETSSLLSGRRTLTSSTLAGPTFTDFTFTRRHHPLMTSKKPLHSCGKKKR
jgi:hypothetical protein